MLRGEQGAKCLQTVSTLNIQFYPQESHEERGFNMSFIDNIIHTIHKIIISPYQIICASDTNSSIISTASQILGPDLSRICTILSSESVEFSFSISSVILPYSSLFWTNLKIISRSSFLSTKFNSQNLPFYDEVNCEHSSPESKSLHFLHQKRHSAIFDVSLFRTAQLVNS